MRFHLETTKKYFSQKVTKGTIWIVANALISVGVQLSYTVIFSRLLSPQDFGLWATVLAVILLAQNIGITGAEPALIQRPGNVEELLNSAWSMELVRGAILSISVFLLAPLVAGFYKEPDIAVYIRAISPVFLIQGLRNIGVIFFRKNLDFFRQFLLEVIPSAIGLSAAMAYVLYQQTIWALIVGYLVSIGVLTGLSYFMHPFRPKLEISWQKWRNLFSFGFWIFANALLNMIREQFVAIFAGRFLGFAALGYYNRSEALTTKFQRQMATIAFKIGFPALSRINTSKERLRSAYLSLTHIYPALILPIAGGAFAIANNLVSLLLGDRWIPMVPLIRIVSIHTAIEAIVVPTSILLVAMGTPGIATRLGFLSAGILLGSIYPLTAKWGIMGVPIAILLGTALIAPTILLKGARRIEVSLWTALKGPFVAAVATFLMGSSVFFLNHIIALDGWFKFGILIILGAVIYLLLLLILGHLFRGAVIQDLKALLNGFFAGISKD